MKGANELDEFDWILRYISIVGLSLALVIMIGAAIIVTWRRKWYPVKAHSVPLLLLWWFGGIGTCGYHLSQLITFGEGICFVDIWIRTIWQTFLLFSVVLMCARLLCLYYVTKFTLDLKDHEGGDEEKGKKVDASYHNIPKWKKLIITYGSNFYSNKFLMKTFGVILLISLFITIIASTIASFTMNQPEGGCSNGVVNFLQFIPPGIAAVLLVILAFLLYRVHDGFYLKVGLELLGLLVIITGIPTFALIEIPSVEYIGWVFRTLYWILQWFPLYYFPAWKTFKHNWKE